MRLYEDSKVATECGLVNDFSYSASSKESNQNGACHRKTSFNLIYLYKAKQIVQ